MDLLSFSFQLFMESHQEIREVLDQPLLQESSGSGSGSGADEEMEDVEGKGKEDDNEDENAQEIKDWIWDHPRSQ